MRSNSEGMRKILIGDDHPVIRKGLMQILQSEFTDIEFGEASNGAEVLDLVDRHEWDILILDMDMPGRSGLEVLAQLRASEVRLPVLVLSMYPPEQLAVRVIRAGANGYLGKDSADTELIAAVRTILNGRKYITPGVAEQMARQLEYPQGMTPHEVLSDREYQTLLMIASGKTVSQIAEELSLSVATVSTYRSRILEKMGMKTNAELTHYAVKNNLV